MSSERPVTGAEKEPQLTVKDVFKRFEALGERLFPTHGLLEELAWIKLEDLSRDILGVAPPPPITIKEEAPLEADRKVTISWDPNPPLKRERHRIHIGGLRLEDPTLPVAGKYVDYAFSLKLNDDDTYASEVHCFYHSAQHGGPMGKPIEAVEDLRELNTLLEEAEQVIPPAEHTQEYIAALYERIETAIRPHKLTRKRKPAASKQ